MKQFERRTWIGLLSWITLLALSACQQQTPTVDQTPSPSATVEPPADSGSTTQTLIATEAIPTTAPSGDELVAKVNAHIRNIDTATLKAQLDTQPNTLLIDVRTPSEIKRFGTIGMYQNINLPRSWTEFRIQDQTTDLNQPIVVYCGINARSPFAAKTLQDMGYTNVANYADGYFEWEKQGLPVKKADLYPASFLYSEVQKISDRVYTSIGATEPSTYENAGHNNNLSFVIADDAVVVFNAGGSYLLAESLHNEIKKITDLPVKYVVLENAQGHAMMGTSYWQSQGATVIAHEHTAEIMAKENVSILQRVQRRLLDKAHNTQIAMPDITFHEETYPLDVKGITIEVKHLGHAHSPDDIQLWLPESKILISGDIAFNIRMLPVLHHTDVREWLETWPKLEALEPKVIIPGHGDPTDLATVNLYTKDYLTYMLDSVLALIDEGGDLNDAYNIDQSAFMQWHTYRELHRQNAERLFTRLEFE